MILFTLPGECYIMFSLYLEIIVTWNVLVYDQRLPVPTVDLYDWQQGLPVPTVNLYDLYKIYFSLEEFLFLICSHFW